MSDWLPGVVTLSFDRAIVHQLSSNQAPKALNVEISMCKSPIVMTNFPVPY